MIQKGTNLSKLVATSITLLLFFASPALARCVGTSLIDRLSSSDLTQAHAAAAATPFGTGLFWEAAKDGRSIRLVGTMHIHDARHDDLMPHVVKALDGADLVLLELTPTEEALAQQALLTEPERLLIQSGPTLPELLDETTWDAVAEAARSRQIPPFMAAKFQPWYLSMSLALPACTMPDLLAGRRGLDHRIMDLATSANIPMQALEPWDTLFDLMSDGSQSEQLEMLRLSLVPDDLQVSMMVAMLDDYFAEEVARVWEISRLGTRLIPGLDSEEAEALFADLQTDLLDTRNLAWMPVINAATQDHDQIVIAVGAAHLPGETGLLRLLEKSGWTISRGP